jgi:hypothetical protein
MGRVGFVTILIATAVGSTVAASSALGERQLVAALLANMTVAEKARQVGTLWHTRIVLAHCMTYFESC